MNPRRRIWLRLATGAVAAAAGLIVLAPARPGARVPALPAAVLGVGCGAALFALVARRRPQLPFVGSWPLLVGKLAVFGIWATSEEVVWRRVALGELLPVGALPALAASSAGFALLHRARRLVHFGTGGIFGLLYLSTGALAASVAAHWAYNVFVAALVERSRV